MSRSLFTSSLSASASATNKGSMSRLLGLRLWGKLIRQDLCFPSRRMLHVCIVGSGPAGFYTAEKVLKACEKAQVDILERLPTPFGLVRSGVAPDHPETKIVVNQFSRVASHERCSFFGNVSLGSSVSLTELRELYNVVVLAYGAESDRSLGVPGENLRGIHSAREFVWWYNGHPDCYNMLPDLKRSDTAVVLGQGNVALDVARILLRPVTELETTDIAEHALVSLRESTIRKVYLVGRRGPVQAACTAKELREILGLKNIQVCVKESDLITSPRDEEELKGNRIHRRVYELLCKAATSSREDYIAEPRELQFAFFRSPNSFLPSDDGCNVRAVRFEETQLKEDGSGKQIAIGTGRFEDIECGLVLKSIGYKSLPVEGLPFDEHRGVLPNIRGRVLSGDRPENANVEQRLYVVGWLKRGPTGIIGTNLHCAEETVSSILEDLQNGLNTVTPKPGRQGLLRVLEEKNIRFVPFSDWEKIDFWEKTEGHLRNKPRQKLTTWNELLTAATGSGVQS